MYRAVHVLWCCGAAVASASGNVVVGSAVPRRSNDGRPTVFAETTAASASPVVPAAVADRKLTVPEILIAGSAARGVAQTIMYPMDAVKTLVQQNKAVTVKAITNGAISTSTLSLPAGLLQFAVYDTLKPSLLKAFPSPKLEVPVELFAGSCGAFASCLAAVPQEVLKQRVIVGIYPNAFSGLGTLLRDEGVGGLYTGFGATVARNIPFNALCFMFTSKLKVWYANQLEDRNPNSVEVLGLGIVAATMSALLTNPIDVVKTRLMTQAAGQSYAGIGDCLMQVMTKEGPLAFYKGIVPRVLYLAPTFGLIFAVNNAVKSYFLRRPAAQTKLVAWKDRTSASINSFLQRPSPGGALLCSHRRPAQRGLCYM